MLPEGKRHSFESILRVQEAVSLNNKRGSTLAELVIVMAVVSVMSVMVVSFTIICSSWSTLGVKRYHVVQDSELFSKVFHEFVAEYDGLEYIFSASPNSLTAKKGDDEFMISFEPETKVLTYDIGGEPKTIALEAIESVDFRTASSEGASNMVSAEVNYDFVTPGKKVLEQHRQYRIVTALRLADVN